MGNDGNVCVRVLAKVSKSQVAAFLEEANFCFTCSL